MSEDQKRWIFNDLYEKYFKKVLHQVARILRADKTHAEDIAQDAFLQAYNKCDLEAFNTTTDFLRWVYTVARNLSYNYLRHQKYEPKHSLHQKLSVGEGEKELEELIPDTKGITPDKAAEQDELISRLWEGLNRLSSEYKAAVELCCIEGYSYKRAAVALNSNENIVAHNLMRARKKLNYIMNTYGE